MPGSSRTPAAGIEFASDGAVIVGPEFRKTALGPLPVLSVGVWCASAVAARVH